jgi:hypothetical protein
MIKQLLELLADLIKLMRFKMVAENKKEVTADPVTS